MQTSTKNWMLMSVMALGLVASLSSCKDDKKPEPKPDPAEFAVVEDEVAVPFEGGAAQVTYTLENPVEGGVIAFQSDAVWVNTEDLSTDGVIKFNVDPNEEKAERTAKVTVTYGELSDSFVVKQAPYVEPAPFEIIIPEEKITTTAVSFQVIPLDKEMTYISMLVDKALFDQFATPEEYIQDDIAYFTQYADMYGMTLEDFLSEYALMKGDSELSEVTGLSPETDYIVYAYGMTAQAEVLTEFCYEQVKTKAPEKVDISFQIECEVDGPMVNAEVTPSVNNQKYVFDAVAKADYTTDAELKSAYQSYLSEMAAMYEMFGMSAEDFVNEISNTGKATISLELSASTAYIGFAVAIDNTAILVSDLTIKEFTTGEVEPSDNKITVEITNVTARTADLKITTTNNDPYVFGTDMKANWEGMSDEEILNELITNYNLDQLVHSGNYETKMSGYNPNTEYISFTFGYLAGTATTDLIRVEFKTKEAEQSDVTFKLLHDKYFNGDEVEAEYPSDFYGATGYAVLPVTVEALPVDKVSDYVYHILEGDITDISEYSDDEIVQFLLQQGINSPSTYFYLTFDSTSTIVGFAIDNDGNYGPVSRELLTLPKDGVSPIDEFPAPSAAAAPASLSARFTLKSLPVISVEDLQPVKNDGAIRFMNKMDIQPGKKTEKKIDNTRYMPAR